MEPADDARPHESTIVPLDEGDLCMLGPQLQRHFSQNVTAIGLLPMTHRLAEATAQAEDGLTNVKEGTLVSASTLPPLFFDGRIISKEELAYGNIGIADIAPYYADHMRDVLGAPGNVTFKFDSGDLHISYKVAGLDFVMCADSFGTCTLSVINGNPTKSIYSIPTMPWHTTLSNKIYHMWVAFAVMAGHLDADFVIV
jgi:hypothetical protein